MLTNIKPAGPRTLPWKPGILCTDKGKDAVGNTIEHTVYGRITKEKRKEKNQRQKALLWGPEEPGHTAAVAVLIKTS